MSKTPNYLAGRLLKTVLTLIMIAIIMGGQGALAQNTPATPVPSATTASTAAASSATIHVVQRGENLFRIAIRYGTTVDAITSANGLSDVTQIQVGQRLLIPGGSAPIPGDPPGANTDGAVSAPGIPSKYIVQPGDSLFSLSQRYSMDIAAIARQNKILNPFEPLYSGLSLSLQEGANGHPSVKTGHIYVVQPDDTIYRIAARYGVTLETLVDANQLGRIPTIYPGQRLVIPGAQNGPILLDVPLPIDRLALLPAQPEQGRTMELQITTMVSTKLTAHFMGKTLFVASDIARTNHKILFGIDAFAKPGIYLLDITTTDAKGKQTTILRNIAVNDGGYPSEQIQLPPEQLDLLDPKVTQPELDKVFRIVSKYSDQSFINGPMGLPCAAPITSQFGTRRSYNGGPYNQWHAGTDFAALPGSAIYAPAGGVVVMAETLHVRGNATIIDHGHGIYTGYWHQSEIKVKVGDIVSQGQVIGVVGSTGRATGPHLHWEMFVQGVQVDPLQWTREPF
jgi:murein DD-endopeptidase MepM/ murein hydrolase activator NlpD